MLDYTVLAHIPDLFGLGLPRFATRNSSGAFKLCRPEDISSITGIVVSFETNILVDQLRTIGIQPPTGLVELQEALRLSTGRSKSDRGSRYWNVWRTFQKTGAREHTLTKELFFAEEVIPDEGALREALFSGCEALDAAWKDALTALKSRGELDRFTKVEIPIQRIFFHRQWAGIALNTEKISDHIRSAKLEKYAAYLEVARRINVSPTGLTFRNVAQYLDGTDAAHLAQFSEAGNFEDHFKIAAQRSEFARHFMTYMKATRDVNTLNRLSSTGYRLHPFFHPIGTVTGRVLVSEPHLQQLRKAYRGVIAADPNHELVYLDYRQFEPGIMAHLSADKGLIEAYNSSDLYAKLSEAVFGNTLHRTLCKKLFLAFCYGMEPAGLSKLIVGPQHDADEHREIADSLDKFFSAFPGLMTLKRELERELLEFGYIETLWGNRRYRTKSGALTREEMRWSLSQKIQGTASLIFKEAMLGIVEEFGLNCLILPIHDAVLLQFHKSELLQGREKAAQIMAAAFRARCPSVMPKISDEPFSQDPGMARSKNAPELMLDE